MKLYEIGKNVVEVETTRNSLGETPSEFVLKNILCKEVVDQHDYSNIVCESYSPCSYRCERIGLGNFKCIPFKKTDECKRVDGLWIRSNIKPS